MRILIWAKDAAYIQECLSKSLNVIENCYTQDDKKLKFKTIKLEAIESESTKDLPRDRDDLNRIDLWIVDRVNLIKLKNWRESEYRNQLEFTPSMLIINNDEVELVNSTLLATVDDVMFMPINQKELLMRVEKILISRTRVNLPKHEPNFLDKTSQIGGRDTRDRSESSKMIDSVTTSQADSRNLLINFVADIQDYAIFMLNSKGQVTSWNAGAQRIMGYTAEDIIGQHFSKFYPEADRLAGKPDKELQMVMTAGQCEDEGWRERASGAKFWAQNTIYAVYDDPLNGSATVHHPGENQSTLPVIGFSVITHDLSDRKEIEEELCQLNRSLRTIWECSQAVVRAAAESELLDEICRIIVEIGKYPLAWVGLIESGKTINPVACAGLPGKYIEALNLTGENQSVEFQSLGKAISTGQPYICQDITKKPGFYFNVDCVAEVDAINPVSGVEPWKDWAMEHGYAAYICLPLIRRGMSNATQEMRQRKYKTGMDRSSGQSIGECFGVLTIYAMEINAFNPQEVKLLQELANDLAYGMMALRNRHDRIQAETALRQSEQRYRQLVQLLPDAVIIHHEGKIELINAAGIKLLSGDAIETLIGRSVQDFVPADAVDIFQQPISPVVEAPEAISFRESTIQRLDGQIIPVSMASITYKYRNVSSVLTVLRNISKRKEALEALQESEQRFRTTFTGAAIGMAIIGLDGKFLEVNSALQAMLGYTEAQLRSMSLIQVTHGDDLAVGIHLFDQMLQSKWENYQIEQRYLNSRSQVVWGNLSVSLIRDREQAPQFIIAMVEDITERKRAEQELRQYRDHLEELVQIRTREKTRLIISLQETNQKLQKEVSDRRRAESALLRVTQAVESTSDAVAMTDLKGMATYHNPAFVKIFGYTLDLINQAGGFAAIFADREIGEEVFATIISGENWSGEVRLRTREGQLVDSFLRADAVKDENGQIIGAIAVNTDITPIKQAEAALRETSEQLQCLINAMPDIVCFKDSQGHWKIANQAMIELFHLEEIDYQGKTNSQLAAEIESYHGRSDYRETLIHCEQTDEITWSQGTISYSEAIVPGDNGSPRSFDTIKVPLFHPDGSRNAIVLIGRDVSDRKQAEAAKMLLASIVESSDDAIIGKNLEGIIQSWNAGAERIYGYTAAEVQGQSISILSVPSRTAEVPQLLTGIQQGTSLDHYETVHRRKNGEEIYVSLTLSPIKNSQGEITGVSTIARDITDLKRVEEALERIRHQNELILNSAGEGICGLDERGNTTFINRAAAQMLGYSIAELHGKPFSTILNSNSAPIYAALKDGSVHHTSDAVFWRKDGSSFPVDYISTPIEEQGKIVGAVVTFNDISDRLAIERMKNEFISVVSHELRTPLTSIRGAMGLLASGVLNTDPDKAQKMLDIAVANTDRLVRLINDILDLERIQSGTVTMRKQMFDIADLMSQASDTMRGIAEKAGVTLDLEPLSAQVWGDSDRIFQVLTNLLSNAIKFSEPGGTVWLSGKITSVPPSSNVNQTQRELLILVEDQGRGIPPDKLETIFGRFQQVDSSDSRKKGGTGLGLAICRSILDYHGGRIWAESDRLVGSCFYVALPLFSLLEPQDASNQNAGRSNHSDATD